jgi:aminoglycoside 6'-N-acetyltransferase I
MKIRKADFKDKSEWARMRNALYSGSLEEHLEEITNYFLGNKIGVAEVFVLERNNGKLGGFIELNVRDYAAGSKSFKIPYVEGWYVDSDLRNHGYGKKLIKIAETWAIENGFKELASDTEIENFDSIAAHKALGFKEVEQIVCFVKQLN